jgi:hypothetical protein
LSKINSLSKIHIIGQLNFRPTMNSAFSQYITIRV